MDGINAATLSPSATAAPSRSAADLTSDDFFKLLITQLQQQDPMEPMDNTEMLKQIASVREIELSSTLTESLRSLTGQQQFTSASSLIGQFVTSHPDESGMNVRGVVEGVRFDAGGSPVLQLANGSEIPLAKVASIRPPLGVAEAMIGQIVTGVDRRDAIRPRMVEGVATSVRVNETGEVLLELDTGDGLRLRDVLTVREAEA